MTETSTCTAWRCGAVTPGSVASCPTCGAKTVSAKRLRTLGWFVAACGLFLVVLMGVITYYVTPLLNRPGDNPGGATRFDGPAEHGRMILNLFWGVIAFGLLCLAGGAWQIVQARRSRLFQVLVIIGGVALGITAWETTRTLENAEKQRELERFAPPEPMTPANFGGPAPDKPQ